MSDCSKFQPLLLAKGDDLSLELSDAVERHIGLCPGCRDERTLFLQLIAAARFSGGVKHELPASVRCKIALEAAAGARRRPWLQWLPALDLSFRPGLVVALAASLVVLLAIPLLWRESARTTSTAVDARLELVANRGVVRLAWTDGQRREYTVLKSSDPRGMARAETFVVRGNVWVDPGPDSSPIVFYRIE